MSQNTMNRITQPIGPPDRQFSGVGAVAAILGVVVYFISAMLHPGTPPHETEAAFAHYAVEPFWGVIHLAELLGVLLMSAAGIALTWRLRRGSGGVWATLGGAAMIVFAGVYAIFAAVDGVALGVLVRRWAEAGGQHDLYFETAFAVRQVEAGLFALQWFMFAVAASLFAPAFFKSPLHRRWSRGMGVLSVLASLGALSFAIVQAQTGFTETSMAFQAGLYLGVAWILAVGLFLFRSPTQDGVA